MESLVVYAKADLMLPQAPFVDLAANEAAAAWCAEVTGAVGPAGRRRRGDPGSLPPGRPAAVRPHRRSLVTAPPPLAADIAAGLRRLKLFTIRQLAPELLVAVGIATVGAVRQVRCFTAADLTETLYPCLADDSVIENLLRKDLVQIGDVGFRPVG